MKVDLRGNRSLVTNLSFKVTAQSNSQRGRIQQSKAANLIGRLRDYSDDVWRFMTDPSWCL